MIKQSEYISSDDRIFDKPYTSHASPYYQIVLRIATDNVAGFVIYSDDTVAYLSASSATQATAANTWAHIVASADVNAPFARVYVNGVLKAEDTTSSGNYVNWNHGMAIGRLFNTGAFHFPGIIDDLRIYNRILSEEERQALYLEGE